MNGHYGQVSPLRCRSAVGPHLNEHSTCISIRLVIGGIIMLLRTSTCSKCQQHHSHSHSLILWQPVQLFVSNQHSAIAWGCCRHKRIALVKSNDFAQAWKLVWSRSMLKCQQLHSCIVLSTAVRLACSKTNFCTVHRYMYVRVPVMASTTWHGEHGYFGVSEPGIYWPAEEQLLPSTLWSSKGQLALPVESS